MKLSVQAKWLSKARNLSKFGFFSTYSEPFVASTRFLLFRKINYESITVFIRFVWEQETRDNNMKYVTQDLYIYWRGISELLTEVEEKFSRRHNADDKRDTVGVPKLLLVENFKIHMRSQYSFANIGTKNEDSIEFDEGRAFLFKQWFRIDTEVSKIGHDLSRYLRRCYGNESRLLSLTLCDVKNDPDIE